MLAESLEGTLLFEDFAHHPTSVKQTIEAFRERFKERRIFVLFEPRSNTSRRSIFQKEYAQALSLADVVTILEPDLSSLYSKDSNKVNALDLAALKEDIGQISGDSPVISSFLEVGHLLQWTKDTILNGDVLVIMSNGSFGNLARDLANYFKGK